jgi:hypothetical protein
MELSPTTENTCFHDCNCSNAPFVTMKTPKTTCHLKRKKA